MMRSFKTTSLADQVFEQLEQDIVMGRYAQGQVLTELKLVEQLGVSRTPIREALRRLEQEHLIADTGKGSVVLGTTDEDLLDIMEIRRYVEPMASFHAAKNATDEQLNELRHILQLQEFYSQQKDSEHLTQMDTRFHHAICTFSGRAVIRDTLIPLHRRITRFRKAALKEEDQIANAVQEHREIYEAIASHDHSRAAELTAQHIESARRRMIERMKDNG